MRNSLPLPLLLLLLSLGWSSWNCLGANAKSLPEYQSLALSSLKDTPSNRLMELVSIVKEGGAKGKPSGKLVLEAYNEYVNLYKLQNDLMSNFDEGASGGGQSKEATDANDEAEKKYALVSELLQMSELQLITQNLFNVLQEDYALGELSMNPELNDKLEGAINGLFS